MTSELKPCPFCLRPLKRSSGKFNPMAVCETDGCWMKEKQIAVPCDDPFSVKSWNTRAEPDVPELVRYEFSEGVGEYVEREDGEYVLYSEAAAKVDTFKGIYKSASRGNEKLRAKLKAAEAKLAQYENQKPVAYMIDGHAHNDPLWQAKGVINRTNLYASPAPAADLKAENEKLREALKPLVDQAKERNAEGLEWLNSDTVRIPVTIGELRSALNVEVNN